MTALKIDQDVIDSHKLWLDTNGEEGMQADFSKVNPSLASLESADLWIIINQLDKHNLSDFAKAELVLKHKGIILGKAEGGTIDSKSPISEKLKQKRLTRSKGNTIREEPTGQEIGAEVYQQIAKLIAVSEDDVRKVEEIVERAPKYIKDKARSGDMDVEAAYNELQWVLTETRRCRKCEKNKRLADFYFRHLKNRWDKTCKQCRNERKKQKLKEKNNMSTDTMTRILLDIQSEPKKRGMYAFIVSGINTLSNAVKQVKDDLDKYLEEVYEESERNDIKLRLQQEVNGISKLIEQMSEN